MVSVRVGLGRGGTTRSSRGQARFRFLQSRVRVRPQQSGPVVLCRRRCLPYEGAEGEDEVGTYASYGGTYDDDDDDDHLAMPLRQPHLQSSVPWMTGAPGAAVSSSSSSVSSLSRWRAVNRIPRTLEGCRERFVGYQVYAYVGGPGGEGEGEVAVEPIGIVDDVLCAGDDVLAYGGDDHGEEALGDYFLLKVEHVVVSDNDEDDDEKEDEDEDEDGEEDARPWQDSPASSYHTHHHTIQHLIPLVPSIVPSVDPVSLTLTLSPPPGLLDLGRRQAALRRIDRLLRASGIVSSVYIESEGGAAREELRPKMPTRRELEEMGRQDVVKLILECGGFLEVAACLGWRGRRKPVGYWEDEEVLDRELSLFVGGGWVRMEALSSSSEDDDDDDDDRGVDDGVDGQDDDDDDGDEEFDADDIHHHHHNNTYWFNTITRQLQWTPPSPPELIPLDDMGMNSIIIETDADRAMPSRSSLLAAGRYDLHTAIVAQGGYTEVAKTLNRWPAWPPTRKLRNIKALKSEIGKFIREHHLDKRYLPAASDFLDMGRPDLHQVIVGRYGGYKAVGRRIGLKSHRGGGVDWRDFAAVCAEVQAYCREKGLEVLPTHEELRKAGRHDLRYAMQKWGSARVSEASGIEVRSRRGGWKGRRGESREEQNPRSRTNEDML